MKVRAILIFAIVVLLAFADVEARKSSSSGSSRRGYGGSNRGTNVRTTSRPRGGSGYGSGGSEPGKVGWNVPEKKPTNTNSGKPSAPAESTISRTSATNVQSGYNPSGGYPRQPANNPYHTQNQGYNPSVGQGYNPSAGQGYNPSVGSHVPHGSQTYNPSYNSHTSYGQQPYGHQSYGQQPYGQQPYGQHYSPGSQSYGQTYHNPYGGSHIPSYGQTPQQTVVLQPIQSSRPGIGQLAKEAFVYAGVSAGVNAAVSRILPGGIYGHHGTSSGGGGGAPVGGGTTHTEIHNTYYYNNGSAPEAGQPAAAAPAAPVANSEPSTVIPLQNQNPSAAPNNYSPDNAKRETQSSTNQQNNPNPLGYVDNDLKRLTEELYAKDTNNAFKHITVNLQGQKKDDSTSDDAPESLLTVKPEAYEIPTIKAVVALHDNYEMDVRKKEEVSSEERREESELLDKFLETEVMKGAMKYLSNKGYIPDDEYEFKDTLKRIWFSQFKRMDGDASSSGFETVYLAEQFDSEIIGLHNWIYYARQEVDKKIDYLGYIKQATLGDKGSIIKLRSKVNGIVQPVTTIFVGTSPELEMALYTLCFFTQPSSPCTVSLGGTEFIIVANRVNYFGKDIIISGYPDI